VHGGGAGGSVVGPVAPIALGPVPISPVASAPVHIQTNVPVVPRALPVPTGPAYMPGPPYAQSRPASSYSMPTPNKLYVDRPHYQNVLVAA
jgi:hypothetical protein